ncbi:hypothetical protein N7490_005030 [Penicillium lividum]|nr:hypothetical protein N7490_005030 [Penicillium lividum]
MPAQPYTNINLLNDLVGGLYEKTPDLADELRELVQDMSEQGGQGLVLPRHMHTRTVTGPDEPPVTLKEWIDAQFSFSISGSAQRGERYGGRSTRYATPVAHHTHSHPHPHAHTHAPGYHAHHAPLPHRPRHTTPVAHAQHGGRETRHATPGTHRTDRHTTPAHAIGGQNTHHANPIAHRGGHQGSRSTRHATPAPLGPPLSAAARQGRPGGSRNEGVSERVINQLTRPIVTQGMLDSDDNTCVICQDDVKVGDEVMLLPCSHRSFHADCLVPWLRRSNTCPTCRVPVQ